MALHLNAIYGLTGPDGTRVCFNDPADADYVGILQDISGFDSPDVRENGDVFVEGDGGYHGNFYYGRRPISLSGVIIGVSPTQRNQRMDKIVRATNAMRADATLLWAEAGRAQTRLLLRRASPVRFGSVLPKTFQVGLVSASHLVESSVLNALTDNAPPLSIVVTNTGDTSAYPVLKVYGAATTPITITNTTTGEVVKLNSALASGANTRQVDCNPITRSIVDESGVNKYAELDFLATSWISLAPGNNTITSDKGSRLDVSWRDAWL